MRAYDLILKKRNGGELTTAEIEFLISGYTAGEIADYQMAALCMAIYFQGMSIRETADLTMAMAYSGDVNDLSGIEGTVIDKHSTGGVGDTTTLIVAPLVASCGVPVAKMSGRGLGHTGGTIDKLESIPGFQTEISQTEFVQQVNQIKLGLIAQTEALVPADKQLYALRDVTATVDSIPLIAASIMSKKIASGADGFVLDVKTGRGALMQNYAQSEVLAKTMVAIGKKVGKPTVALITDMDQPLGYAVGNALEVKEAISVLSGQGAADLTDLCLHLGAEMLVLAGHSPNQESGYKVVEQKLKSKAGLEKFRELISWQGGDPRVVGDLSLLPQASYQTEVRSRQSGYVSSIDALKIGSIAMQLGAGRKTKNSSIDLGVGIELKAKVGGYVERDQPLAVIHSNQPLQQEPQLVLNAFSISQARPQQRSLIWAKITEADV